MSHYSTNESDVRVSIFKPSGKWYTDIAVNMGEYYNHADIHQALLLALSDAGQYKWYEQGYTLVCLEPHHRYSHPVMLRLPNGR